MLYGAGSVRVFQFCKINFGIIACVNTAMVVLTHDLGTVRLSVSQWSENRGAGIHMDLYSTKPDVWAMQRAMLTLKINKLSFVFFVCYLTGFCPALYNRKIDIVYLSNSVLSTFKP